MNNQGFQKAKNITFALVALALALSLLLPASSTQALPQKEQPAGDTTPVGIPTDQIIIKWTGAGGPIISDLSAAAASSLSAAGATFVDPNNPGATTPRKMSGGSYVLQLFAVVGGWRFRLPLATVQTICDELMKNVTYVEYAEPDRILRLTGVVAPNDTYYDGAQWNLKQEGSWGIKVNEAWDLFGGDANIGSPTVVIAILDTGITLKSVSGNVLPSHEDLDRTIGGRFLQGYDFVSNDFMGIDEVGRDNVPADVGDYINSLDNSGTSALGFFTGCGESPSSWHGTRIAGLIGAEGDNNKGIAGINWHSLILPVRVLGKCGGYTSDIVDGMRWAAGGEVGSSLEVPGVSPNGNPANVINLSLGGPGACSRAEQSAINDVTEVGSGKPGAVVVAAAGGYVSGAGADVSNFSPANCNGVITVASTDSVGRRSSFSNYGSTVEISAPGGGNGGGHILSTSRNSAAGPELDLIDPSTTYDNMDGTSMAAAEVSGVVSLMFSVDPTLTPDQVLKILQTTAYAFNDQINENHDPLCSNVAPYDCGSGILNAYDAVRISQKPDLAIAGVTLNPITPVNNTNFAVNITIKNSGTNIATPFYTSVCIGGAGSACSGGAAYPVSVAAAAGASTTETIPIPIGRVTNQTTIYAYVDSTNVIDEGFEDNNSYGSVNSFDPVSRWTSSFDLSHGWTVADFVRTVGDVNGDGRADLVGFGLDGAYVALSNGSNGFDPISKWTSSFDLSHGWTVADFVRTVGDVNGDGRADLVGFGQDGVYVALSNGGSSFGPISKWTSSFDLSHGWTVKDFVRTVGDVNHDGKTDLVGFGQDGVYVALSNGSGFGPISKWTSSFDLSHGWTVQDFVRTVGDVNGDGNADLVGFGQDGVYVALSDGSSSFGAISKWTSSFDLSHGWTVADFVRTVGDVNGDGNADLVGFGLDGVYVALSDGSSGFDPISKWTDAFDLSHGWTVQDFARTVGDVSGDGKADLVGFGLDGAYIAIAK